MARTPSSAPEPVRVPNDTRQRIIEAALDLYADGGQRGTGLVAIGERVGISHNAVLYHFGSARNLLFEVLQERQRRVAEELGPVWTGTPTEVIAGLPAIARLNVAKPGLAKLFTVVQAENLEPDAPFHDWFVEVRRATRRSLRAVVRKGVRTGEFRADVDAGQVADEILAFIAGAEVHQFLDPDTVDLVKLYKGFTAALLARIVVRANGGRTRTPGGARG